jgi:hypothetical protein
MIQMMVIVFALTVGWTAQAAPPAGSHTQFGNMVFAAREGCGAGYQNVAGRCVRNSAVRTFRRCAAGYRLTGNRCIRRSQ